MTTAPVPFVNVPREAVDGFVDDAKRNAVHTAERLLRQVADGKLTPDEAIETFVEAIGGAIDATATLVDVALALPSPAEELSDLAIQQGAEVLKGLAAKPLGKAIAALDDAVGYNPRRAARRLAEALDADLQDGIVGDDHRRRVYRLARRIATRSPALAVQIGIEFGAGDQLFVDGVAWSTPPRRFEGPTVENWGAPTPA